MFTIGDFARHGRVSVRMLRHYDELGLLPPARVDVYSGYRYYEAAQLAVLNRIVALKGLGFTLAEVASILHEQVSAAELRGMLRLRQTELRAQIEADSARLRQVEVRLRVIENEEVMPATEVVVKSLPAVRVAELTGHADGYNPDSISRVIRPLYGQLMEQISAAGISFVGPAVAYYEDHPDGGITVHAAMPINAERGDYPFTVVDLPAVERAATLIHHGSMDEVLWSWQSLAQWISANENQQAGYAREETLHYSENTAEWVTELQIPI